MMHTFPGTYCPPVATLPVSAQTLPAAYIPLDCTTFMGLGYKHDKARADALASFVDGMLCWRCSRPMHRWQKLDLDHTVPRALGGQDSLTVLTHRHCNRAAGARLKNRLSSRTRHRHRTSRSVWLVHLYSTSHTTTS